MKLAIWELYWFFNSIDFYSKLIVWEYISFSNNIPIVWNFKLPILCGSFGCRMNFWFPQKLTPREWYGFLHNISILWEFVHSQTSRIAWKRFSCGVAKNMENLCVFQYFSHTMEIHFPHVLGIVWISGSLKIVFSHTFFVLWEFTFPMFWKFYGFLFHKKYLRNP